jgi:hypothetical protein
MSINDEIINEINDVLRMLRVASQTGDPPGGEASAALMRARAHADENVIVPGIIGDRHGGMPSCELCPLLLTDWSCRNIESYMCGFGGVKIDEVDLIPHDK